MIYTSASLMMLIAVFSFLTWCRCVVENKVLQSSQLSCVQVFCFLCSVQVLFIILMQSIRFLLERYVIWAHACNSPFRCPFACLLQYFCSFQNLQPSYLIFQQMNIAYKSTFKKLNTYLLDWSNKLNTYLLKFYNQLPPFFNFLVRLSDFKELSVWHVL